MNTEEYFIVGPIIKEIQVWAKLLCAKKLKLISDFLKKQATIPEFDCTLEEFNIFNELVSKIIHDDVSEAVVFFNNNNNSIINILGSSKPEIVSDFRAKGLFSVVANYYEDKNVQKLVRILDSRVRVHCNLKENEIERLGRFWSSVYILKKLEEGIISKLGMILLKYSFNPKSRENGFFSEIKECEELIMGEKRLTISHYSNGK
jgi:hypothetical protein